MAPRHPKEPFWYALSERHRDELRRAGSVRHYQPGEVIVREQERSDFAVVVLDGCVRVSTQSSGGYQTILGLRDAGDLVGELAGIDGRPRSATLSALTAVEALILPAVSFRAFLRAFPDAAATMHGTVSARLREADHYRAAAGAETTPQRLAGLLLYLGGRYGVTVDTGGVLIELPLSQEDLAGLILASQRTLGRLLEQLRERRIIVTGRRTILLLDLAALRELATG
jgi:CRP/FNR family transcriptional regulator, cyclic AMP receptor protein